MPGKMPGRGRKSGAEAILSTTPANFTVQTSLGVL